VSAAASRRAKVCRATVRPLSERSAASAMPVDFSLAEKFDPDEDR